MKKDIGQRIKQIRIQKGIDAKKIAVEIGVRDTSFSKIEREGTNSVDTLFKIADALGVKIIKLFEDEVSEVKETVPNYGIATKYDLGLVNTTLQKIAIEMAQMREDLLIKRSAYKSTAKKILRKK